MLGAAEHEVQLPHLRGACARGAAHAVRPVPEDTCGRHPAEGAAHTWVLVASGCERLPGLVQQPGRQQRGQPVGTAPELRPLPRRRLPRQLRCVQLEPHAVEVGDLYLLCSDGLSDLVEDEEIALTLTALSANLELAANQLVQMANDNGGKDNISVILVRVLKPYSVERTWYGRFLNWLR